MGLSRFGLRVRIRIGRWGMGRCVWRIVCRGDGGNADYVGVADIAVYSAKIISATYKPIVHKQFN